MQNPERTVVRGYSLPIDQVNWLERQAKAENRSVSNLLRCLIQDAIKEARSRAEA